MLPNSQAKININSSKTALELEDLFFLLRVANLISIRHKIQAVQI